MNHRLPGAPSRQKEGSFLFFQFSQEHSINWQLFWIRTKHHFCGTVRGGHPLKTQTSEVCSSSPECVWDKEPC